jgi:autotransporter-associated beta strand protein
LVHEASIALVWQLNQLPVVITRRFCRFMPHSLRYPLGAGAFVAVLTFLIVHGAAAQFVHPGGLHTQADFDRMQAKVAANQSPWVDSYNQLTPLWLANLNMPWAPVTQIIRGVPGSNYARSQKDALAIYYLALRWRITGDTNYAEEAVEGCDRWSSTMTNGVGGNSNWALGAGICGYEFAIAGETLRGYTNWSQTSISNYCNFLRIFAGGNDSFLQNHNGTCNSHYWCNWDACNIASLISCAVFLDDTNMFNRAVTYLKQGKGNGNLTAAAWFVHPDGTAQQQESGRDQPHAMSGIAWLGVALQVAWNQGVDLYSFDNNLFLRSLEYSAKFNLWNDVPYQTFGVCNTTFGWGTTALSHSGRGFLPPTWDLFYNHYVNVKGLSAPWTARAATVMRPDGFYNNSNSPDFFGFTTLTHLRDPIPAGAVPSGVEAKMYGTNVLLNWWGSAYATNYLIKRATVSGGPYTTIASLPAATENVYFDSTVTNGVYHYVVSAQDKFGQTAHSPEKKIGVKQLTTYYRFNEAGGTTASEASGLSPAATLVNGASFTASGKFGNGVSLNGSSQYVALTNGLITGLGDATISAWVYLNTLTTWARVFDFGVDTDKYMFLSVHNGSGMRFAITKFTGNGEQGINGPALSVGAWHHVAVTLKADNAGSAVGTLYLNGAPVASNSAMTFTPDMIGRLVNATNNYIGRSQWPGDPYLNGRVDDFRIYNGALSAAEIAALYALSPVGPAAPGSASATAVSANTINLSWTPSATATSYLVQRSLISGGPYTVVASGVTSTNHTDSGLTGSTTYHYVIAAANSGGTSSNSPQASAATLTSPPTPTSLTATGLYSGEIILNWAPSPGATSYTVKRSMLPGGPYIVIAASVPSTTFTNTALIQNATYYYVASAVNANGESPDSAEAGALVPVPTLVWKGNVNSTWDFATTTNWLFEGSPSTYFADGAAANFDDTASTAAVNLVGTVSPYSVTFSNTALSYTVNSTNGSGIGGAASLTKLGSGTATLNTTNTFTGDILINGGGTLAVGGGGLLGGGNYAGNIANFSTFNYSGTGTQTLSGLISQSGTLLKTGPGTLTLSGANNYNGNTTHRQGTLNLTGADKTSGGSLYVVDNNAASTTSAMLNISSDVQAYQLWLGDRAGAGQVGAAYHTAGNVVLTRGAGVDDIRIGSVAGGRGYYKLSGGTLTANEAGVGGSQNDTIGIMDIAGGALTINGWLAIARGGATASGLLNITGGSASGARVDMNWSGTSGALSVINVGGGAGPASLTVAPSTSVGVNLAEGSTTAGTLSIVNLRTNGTLTTGRVRAWQANPTTLLNFDGGTLAANISSGTFLTDGNLDGVYVHSKGGTIDNGGKSITVDRSLLAPPNLGVNSITDPSTQGSGYVAPPLVTITGGTGSGGTAYAVMADDGTGKGTFKVTGVVVTSRGVYTVAPTTVTLTGGGASLAASGFSISATANTSGGMTFTGTGITTLGGANTYAGPTLVAGGTVVQGGPLLHLSFDNTNGTNVVNDGSGGAAMNGALTGTNASIVAGGRYGNALQIGSGAATAGYVLVNSPVVALNGQAGNSWAVAMWLKSTTAGGVYFYQGDGGWASGNTEFYLKDATQNSAAGTHAGGVRWGQAWVAGTTNVIDGNWHFVVMSVSNGVKTLYCDGAVDPILSGASSWTGNGTGGQVRIGGAAPGADSQTGFNGLIDDVFVYGRALSLSDVTNLMNGMEAPAPAIPSGTDLAVASGAALVLKGSTQTIGALSGGNSGTIQLGAGGTPTALTFGKASSTTFAGSVAGNGSVTKIGTGDITLSGVNAYSGSTIISNGTVRFGQSDNTNYVATLGPLLWFNFDQGVNLVDGVVTNFGLGGTALNSEIVGEGVTVTSGRYGSGLNLDGTSYLSIPNKVTALDCNADGASWTYALWIKTATAGATFGYQGDGSWSSGATTFYLNNNSVGGTKAGGVRYGDGWMTGTATLNNNAWRFVAITVSGGVKTIYVDGNVDAKTGTTGWNGAASTSANQFWIGDSPDAGDGVVPFNGQLDEVMLFNRALSQAEIQNILSNKTAIAMAVTTGQLPPASPVNLGAAGTLDLTGTTQTIASLSDLNGSGGLVTNSGGVTASLLLNGSLSTSFNGLIGGAIHLVKSGSGTQALNGPNNFTGNTTVNAGTLALGQPTLPTNGVVTVTNGAVLSLNFAATNRIAALVLNGSAQSPGVYNTANAAPYLGGTGSVVIGAPVATNPTNLSFSIAGGSLTLSWPASHAGWRLETQTNSLAEGLRTNWFTVSDSAATNQMTFPISQASPTIFFRLAYP